MATASAGQSGELPVQLSATSHAPPARRHTVEAGASVSAGHARSVPLQRSSTSHAPAEARHSVPALPAVCSQAPEAPQASSVQGLPSSQWLACVQATQPRVGEQRGVAPPHAAPAAQDPPWQASPCVQRLPSSQGRPSALAGSLQVPVAGSQVPGG